MPADAIPGAVAAAKARAVYAAKQRGSAYTGSIATMVSDKAPVAVPGADGEAADDRAPPPSCVRGMRKGRGVAASAVSRRGQ